MISRALDLCTTMLGLLHIFGLAYQIFNDVCRLVGVQSLHHPRFVFFGVIDPFDVLAVFFVHFRFKGPAEFVTYILVFRAQGDAMMAAAEIPLRESFLQLIVRAVILAE